MAGGFGVSAGGFASLAGGVSPSCRHGIRYDRVLGGVMSVNNAPGHII